MPSKSKKIASRQAKLRNKRKKEVKTHNLSAAQLHNTVAETTQSKIESSIESSQEIAVQESHKTPKIYQADIEKLSNNPVTTSINLKSELVRIGITASIILIILVVYSTIQ